MGFFDRLKKGLSKSAEALGLGDILLRHKLDQETLDALEERLIRADAGAKAAGDIVQAVAKGRYDAEITEDELRGLLADEITKVLAPTEKPLLPQTRDNPFVILVAGVNGTGKTTTIGKLARKLTRDGHKVVLAAADTFRAAAVEQLQVWGQRAGADVVARKTGADAAGLAFDAIKQAKDTGADIVLIDTAGRLQNKAGLMDELAKIARVVKKISPAAPHASLLVLDATTGQNAISQVEAFSATVPLTGLIMTKLDGTAKGGILVALAEKFHLPVHFVGVGEGEEDLQVFDAKHFARAMTEA